MWFVPGEGRVDEEEGPEGKAEGLGAGNGFWEVFSGEGSNDRWKGEHQRNHFTLGRPGTYFSFFISFQVCHSCYGRAHSGGGISPDEYPHS